MKIKKLFKNQKPLKITLTVLLILGLYATKLRFGLDNFIEALFQLAGYSLVYACSLIFLANYQKKNMIPLPENTDIRKATLKTVCVTFLPQLM